MAKKINMDAAPEKCQYLIDGILSLCRLSRIKGYDLVLSLICVLVEIIYQTADKKKRNEETWVEVTNVIQKNLLDALISYHKIYTEDEQANED